MRSHAVAGYVRRHRILPVLTLALLLAGIHATAFSQDMCTACHTNGDLMMSVAGDSAKARRLTVDAEYYAESVHGQLGFTCTLCHTGMSGYPHAEATPVNCGGCHSAEKNDLAASVHGSVHPETGEMPATCADCHTDHHILRPSDPESSVYRLTQFEVCATCHEDPMKMGAFAHDKLDAVSTYMHSVHGRGLLEKGLSVAPVCTDCHGENGTGAHGIKRVADTTSSMSRLQLTRRCGQCHAGIMAQYDRGIHGEMFREGVPDAPTCVDCHAEHGVEPVDSPTSHVSPEHVAQTCTSCHDREDFNEKYGVATERGRTFDASFHGIALEGGQVTVANCESCHGSHEILPSSDPASSIHADNLVETCGRCHPGIGTGVARGKIHVASFVEDGSGIGIAVQVFYIAVIGVTVLYALGLIVLDQYRHWIVDPRRRGNRHA